MKRCTVRFFVRFVVVGVMMATLLPDASASVWSQLVLYVQNDWLSLLAYAGVSLTMMLTAPEVLMPFADTLAPQGEMTVWGFLMAGTLGNVLSNMILYSVAYGAGEVRLRRILRQQRRWLPLRERDLDRALRLFGRYDGLLLVGGRCLPLLRTVVSLPAGLARMHPLRFLGFTTLGVFAWNVVLVYLGAALKGVVLEAAQHLNTLPPLYLFIVTLMLVLALLLRRLRFVPRHL